MGKYIGIDLGTTFSVVAYVNESGNPEIIDNQEGENITASAVLFEEGKVIVGTDAKNEGLNNPEHFVGFAKRNMGNSHITYKIDCTEYRPEEISAFILKKLKQDTEKALGEEILGAVITVPAYFTDAQRKATRDAAEIAGIPILSIINEPTAAALAYGLTRGKEEIKKILVYDLGGGTFDVSIMQFGAETIEILSTMGNAELGGYDFDQQIVQWFTKEAMEEGVNLELDLDAKHELLMKAEIAKKSLSTGRNKAKITINVQGKKVSRELTKENFENMIEPILYQTIGLMSRAMEEANLEYSDLNKILLVGGSTRIPLVRTMILDETEIEPSQDIQPDEAVAIGAAFHAVERAKKQKQRDKETKTEQGQEGKVSCTWDENAIPEVEKKYNFVDRTSHGIGVVVVDDYGEEQNSIVLPKNTAVPAQAHKDYCTIVDYQEKILLQITQGDFTEMKYTTIVGEAELQLRPKPKGAPVRVVISCDDEALIHVHVIDLEENDDLGEMKIDRTANMSDEQVKEAQKHVGQLDIGWEN